MKTIILANWGIGLEIVRFLHSLPDINIELVITRHHPRSQDVWENAVYTYAKANGYRTLPEDELTLPELRDEILKRKIEVLIIHAFMRKLPPEVFSAPRYGSINIHPSLLPKYRGPSPTYWILHNREKSTGLTCHYVDDNFDTGPIIYQIEVPVFPEDTHDNLIERQKSVTGDLLRESLRRITDSSFIPISQNNSLATYAPRPSTETDT